MSASLERMGDLAQHIAQLARYRYPESAIPKGLKKIFVRMGALDVEMASKIVELLGTQDPRVIEEVRDLDDDLDELHAKVFEKVLSDKLADNPMGAVDATLASRYHERFGDHAVSIAKQVQFFLHGTLD
jgi:phosphate transport system protein